MVVVVPFFDFFFTSGDVLGLKLYFYWWFYLCVLTGVFSFLFDWLLYFCVLTDDCIPVFWTECCTPVI